MSSVGFVLFIIFVSLGSVRSVTYLSDCVSGRITNFQYGSDGSCGFKDLSEFQGITSASVVGWCEPYYEKAQQCGQCYEIVGPSATPVIVMAADYGPYIGNEQWCSGDMPHMDLGSPQLFDKFLPNAYGVSLVNWREIVCPITGPLKIRMSAGSNDYYVSYNTFNHVVGVEKVRVKDASQSSYTELKRENYNYWPWSAQKLIAYPVTLVATSIYGDEVSVQIPSLKIDGVVEATGTKKQFDEPPPEEDAKACPPPFLPVMFDEAINNGGKYATATHWIESSDKVTSKSLTGNGYQSSNAYCITLQAGGSFSFFNQLEFPASWVDGFSFYGKSSEPFTISIIANQEYNNPVKVSLTNAYTLHAIAKEEFTTLDLSGKIRGIMFRNTYTTTSPELCFDKLEWEATLPIVQPGPGTPGTPSDEPGNAFVCLPPLLLPLVLAFFLA